MGTIKHEARLALYALAVNNIVALVTDTDLAIPLRIGRAAITNSNTAFSSIIPSITFPAVLAICALAAVPAHFGWASSAESWFQFEESFITNALNSVEFTVEGALRDGYHDLIASFRGLVKIVTG